MVSPASIAAVADIFPPEAQGHQLDYDRLWYQRRYRELWWLSYQMWVVGAYHFWSSGHDVCFIGAIVGLVPPKPESTWPVAVVLLPLPGIRVQRTVLVRADHQRAIANGVSRHL